MKAFLLAADRDVDVDAPPPGNAEALTQDLELDTVLRAMADGDDLILHVCRHALLNGLADTDAIVYRQRMLADCLERAPVIRDLYGLAGQAIASERTVWGSLLHDSPSSLLSRSVRVLELLLEFLQRLRALADEHAPGFTVPGFQRFFQSVADELDDAYLTQVQAMLGELAFKGGVLLSAELGAGAHGRSYLPRRAGPKRWLDRISVLDRDGYSFTIPDRDEAGFRALRELEDRGVNAIADAVTRSADHVLSFFGRMRIELSFYVGCLNLHDALVERGLPTCLPTLQAVDGLALDGEGLYDPSLALSTEQAVVGNDVDAGGKRLLVITGANQGGKSTFLRSLGLAQLMAQAGMFTCARELTVSLARGVFTHFKREEDETMESGKLDEELRRMSAIADAIEPECLLLLNESFASTNEREGSELARQVVRAMIESDVRVALVTHQFDLAHGFFTEGPESSLFLRAAREEGGERSYRLIEAEPLPTSYGQDSYRKVFGRDLAHDRANRERSTGPN